MPVGAGFDDSRSSRPGFDAVIERVAWWSEVLTIPCVAYAESLVEAEELAQAGADFIAVGHALWRDANEIAAGITEVLAYGTAVVVERV